MEGPRYVSPEYQEQLDTLAEHLMADRLEKKLRAEEERKQALGQLALLDI